MQNPETKKGRGESAMRIILHKRVHELHKKYIEEAGELATELRTSYYARKIAEEMNYSQITVSRIMNQKPE